MVFSESRFAPMQVKFDVGPAGRMTINHPTTRSNRTRPIELHTSLRENLQRRALTRSPSATKGDELNGGYTALFRAVDTKQFLLRPMRPLAAASWRCSYPPGHVGVSARLVERRCGTCLLYTSPSPRDG